MQKRFALLLAAFGAGCATEPAAPPTGPMSFFVTSRGVGSANLGGLEGADKHCQTLAQAAGAGGQTWRAYLSTQAPKYQDPNAIHARDRIGGGPWFNAKGVLIARTVDELHSDRNNINKDTALDERGERVNSRTDKPVKHDILTGSRPDGTAFPPPPLGVDVTCGNWTKSGKDGTAMLGHFDRGGPVSNATWATSWNSSHLSTGCDLESLRGTGGDGLLYCFAVKQ